MIAIQEYLHSGKTLENLNEEFGIKVCYHTDLPLVILNYDQISSPKTHPITVCCRGLILEIGTWNVVARSFNRFFNLGECEDLQKDFNWNDFYAFEKVDGSLINMFYYDGQWHMATRGSFGEGLMENCNFSWKELFWKTFDDMGHDLREYSKESSFTWELCSRYNKIVTDYPTPTLFLLNWYVKNATTPRFMTHREMRIMSHHMPKVHTFKSVDEVIEHIEDLELNNPTIEGVVLIDKNLNRIKVKNKKYLSLHKMRGESGFTMKNLLPFVIDGETDELLTYYPEVEGKIDQMVDIIAGVHFKFMQVYISVQSISDQKEFALALTSHNFAFQDVLFRAKSDRILHDTPEIWHRIINHPKLHERVFKSYDKESL